MHWERIKVIIRQADIYNKTGDATKGGRVTQFDFTKTFRNQLFSCVRVLYYQYTITNYSERILKSKIMSIFMIIFFLSDLLRKILKCNCSPYSTLMTMYLPGEYYAALHYNHSSVRKVHLVKGHVVYVYWVDTVYVQNNLPTEFSKSTIFII